MLSTLVDDHDEARHRRNVLALQAVLLLRLAARSGRPLCGGKRLRGKHASDTT